MSKFSVNIATAITKGKEVEGKEVEGKEVEGKEVEGKVVRNVVASFELTMGRLYL